MKRTTVWLREDQIEHIKTQPEGLSEYIREAIDRSKALTTYIEDAIEMMEDIHPEMTYEQFQGWLLFRARLKYDGEDRNGGNEEIRAMLKEILGILKHDQRD